MLITALEIVKNSNKMFIAIYNFARAFLYPEDLTMNQQQQNDTFVNKYFIATFLAWNVFQVR